MARDGRAGYRDRSLLHAEHRDGRWELGLLKPIPRALLPPKSKIRSELIPIPGCPVHADTVNTRVHEIRAGLRLEPEVLKLTAVFFNAGFTVFVLKQPKLDPTSRAELARLADQHRWNLWIHLNPSTGRRVMSAKGWEPIGSAAADLADSEGFRYGPTSFRQVLPALHRESLVEAREFLKPSPERAIVDLYCGLGKSLALWREAGAPAIGVEISSAAIRLAERNASGATALVGRTADRLPQLDAWAAAHAERAIYLNPSRTGVEEPVLSWIDDRLRPRAIAYLSCEARTLARDLETLERGGYRVRRLTPYDFFPQTSHVETLALLD